MREEPSRNMEIKFKFYNKNRAIRTCAFHLFLEQPSKEGGLDGGHIKQNRFSQHVILNATTISYFTESLNVLWEGKYYQDRKKTEVKSMTPFRKVCIYLLRKIAYWLSFEDVVARRW